MKETLFVRLLEGNSSSYAATMETLQMIKHRESVFIRTFPQCLDSDLAAPVACILIENT
jgi:hypothetical protein